MEEFGKIYDSIRDAALDWGRRWFGNFGEVVILYIFLLPDLIRLMVNLLADKRVVILDKIFVMGVLIYVISPFDVFPEILIGPFGLVEDLILVLIILYRLMSNPYNHEAIQEHWKGDPDIMAKIQRGFQYIRTLMLNRRR